VSEKLIHILGIETSCDETAASVMRNDQLLSNCIASQELIHRYYGGVVPELASRAHQQQIIPVVEEALLRANITKNELDGIAFTRGPGLMGALLVGVSFAKSLSLALNIPMMEVNHLQGHVLAHFIQRDKNPVMKPSFPFICLTVSGGHTQVLLVKDPLQVEILGETQDDAAGEAFDKAAKIMGFPYPGGPFIDKLAVNGNPKAFSFPHPQVPGYGFSFSGLKTSFLNFIHQHVANDPAFIENHKADICASLQSRIISILMEKLEKAAAEFQINDIAIAGGVSANSGLRNALIKTGKEKGWNVFIPPFEFCTDNAAMIAMAGYYKFLRNDFAGQEITPLARMPL